MTTPMLFCTSAEVTLELIEELNKYASDQDDELTSDEWIEKPDELLLESTDSSTVEDSTPTRSGAFTSTSSTLEPPASYTFVTKTGTEFSTFKNFIKTLPDKGEGHQIGFESSPWHCYVTNLTAEEASRVADEDFVNFITLVTGGWDDDIGPCKMPEGFEERAKSSPQYYSPAYRDPKHAVAEKDWGLVSDFHVFENASDEELRALWRERRYTNHAGRQYDDLFVQLDERSARDHTAIIHDRHLAPRPRSESAGEAEKEDLRWYSWRVKIADAWPMIVHLMFSIELANRAYVANKYQYTGEDGIFRPLDAAQGTELAAREDNTTE